MAILDNIIAKLSPERALRRERAAMALSIARSSSFAGPKKRRLPGFGGGWKRTFEAVSGGRLRSDIKSSSASADAAISGDVKALRYHVRQLEYDNSLVSGTIKRIVDNVIGRGIAPRSTVAGDEDKPIRLMPAISENQAELVNYLADSYWRRWIPQAHSRLLFDGYKGQRLLYGAFTRDGGCLAIGRTSKRKRRLIPYCQDFYEIDRMQTPLEEMTNPRVRNGIRYDLEGVPEAYYILKFHPGDNVFHHIAKGDNFDEVPAYFPNGLKKVLHIFDPTRLEQTIGYSQFASGLTDMQDLDRIKEGEKMAVLMNACTGASIEDGDGGNFFDEVTESSDSTQYDRDIEFAPGFTARLQKGEKLNFHNPMRPNNNLVDFLRFLEGGPAGSVNVPQEIAGQDWKGMNYSNARTVLLQFYAACWIRSRDFIDQYCIPTRENVIYGCISKGLFGRDGAAFIDIDRREDDYMASVWTPMVYRKWVDPGKESKGRETDLNDQVETLTDTLSERGNTGGVKEHLQTIAKELVIKKKLEEKHGVKFPTNDKYAEPVAVVPDGGDDGE